MVNHAEAKARVPIPPDKVYLNPIAQIPYGVQPAHVFNAMRDFTKWLGLVNGSGQVARLETMLMPANFSSIVGEFMTSTIPKYCPTITKNHFHNGHPDMIPAGMFSNDSVRHAALGIEVKASRKPSGWQGHNPEDTWLMVFMFKANRPVDEANDVPPFPFQFLKVTGAELLKDDWQFSGRSETSRRTITAAVKRSGWEKMEANWIYRDTST